MKYEFPAGAKTRSLWDAGLADAGRLTRAVRLTEAAALLRSLIHAPGQSESSAVSAGDAIIEGTIVPPRPDPAQPKRARPTLRETLETIAAGGMPPRRSRGPGAVRPAVPDLPPNATFKTRSHSGPGGTLDYKVYVPAGLSGRPVPLVIMLHGCTQSPDDFAAGTGMNALAEEFGVVVAYPAQPAGANAHKCWNWFRPEDQQRGRGEPELVAGIARDVMRDTPVDPTRVYVAGLSAGGAAAAIVARAYPDVFAAVGVHSGLPVGAARDVASAFAAMRQGAAGTPAVTGVPTIMFHGEADATVHPGNGAAVARHARAAYGGLRSAVRSVRSEGGRDVRVTAWSDAAGAVMCEEWDIAGAGHAWSGGLPEGSYTDPAGPDASREMLRFFLSHRRRL